MIMPYEVAYERAMERGEHHRDSHNFGMMHSWLISWGAELRQPGWRKYSCQGNAIGFASK